MAEYRHGCSNQPPTKGWPQGASPAMVYRFADNGRLPTQAHPAARTPVSAGMARPPHSGAPQAVSGGGSTRIKIMRFVMRSAFITYPKACQIGRASCRERV